MDGLAAGAFDDVVLGAHDDEPAGARVEPPGDFADIRADDIFRVGQCFAFEQTDERLVGVSSLISGGNFFSELGRARCVAEMFARREIQRGQNAAIHRDQMRRELNHHGRSRRQRKLLLNFRQMPVLRHAVRADAFVALAKKIIHLRLAACTADPAQGIGNDAGGLDESWRQQPGSPVYAKDFDVAGVKRALSEATKERKPEWRATANSPGDFAKPA